VSLLKEANEYFNKVEAEYFKLKAKAAGLKEKPTVLLGRVWKDTWIVAITG